MSQDRRGCSSSGELTADEARFLIFVRTLNNAQKRVLGTFMLARQNGVETGPGSEAALRRRLTAARAVPDRVPRVHCPAIVASLVRRPQ